MYLFAFFSVVLHLSGHPCKRGDPGGVEDRPKEEEACRRTPEGADVQMHSSVCRPLSRQQARLSDKENQRQQIIEQGKGNFKVYIMFLVLAIPVVTCIFSVAVEL